MEIEKILKVVDHTLLLQTSTQDEIKQICDDAIKNNVASVCIPPYFVKFAKEYTKGKIPICTVIGFPNGYSTTKTKVFETADAIENGADEIDMVINLGLVKQGEFDKVTNEIAEIKDVCKNKILKVIVETCLLTEDEKIKLCKCVTDANADYIKTSTGFSTGGATVSDIKLFSNNIGNNIKIKAAGGISTLEDAQNLIDAGALRLGTSRIIKIINGMGGEGY